MFDTDFLLVQGLGPILLPLPYAIFGPDAILRLHFGTPNPVYSAFTLNTMGIDALGLIHISSFTFR